MKDFWEWMALVIYLAIIFTLVRPKSQGPTLISNAGNALSGLVKAGTGGGSF